MTIAISSDLLHSCDKQHLMLLYDEESERSSAEIDCLNLALAAGHYCIYATVDANEKDFESKLKQRIQHYEQHLEQGDLRIVNFKPFYDSAASGELAPFRQLKAHVEAALRDRVAAGKSGQALLVADAACNLARHKQFDECVTLEGWWQETYNEWMAKNLDVTIICAHPSSVLKQGSVIKERNRISDMHSLTLDLSDFIRKTGSRHLESQSIRILVAESDADIRMLYGRYLESLPVEVVAVDSAEECLEKALLTRNGHAYDIIIIDTHIKDANALHVAKKILEEKPLQDIVFTTTGDLETLRSDLGAYSFDADRYPLIQKPFKFSQLLAHIKPAKFKMAN